MESFSTLKESMLLRESKESTLNKCVNLTQEQKAEALRFFNGKGQALWSSVDWNRPNNITWDTIKALMDKSTQSNQQMKKRMKNLDVGLSDLVEGTDYNIVHVAEEYILYQLLSHKGACVIASNQVEPKTHNEVPYWAQKEENEWWENADSDGWADGAHWCISMFKTSRHWNEYTEEGHKFFVFCYTGKKGAYDSLKKVCIDLDASDSHSPFNCWDGNDDDFDAFYHTRTEMNDLILDALDHVNSPLPLDDSVIEGWKELFGRFGEIPSVDTTYSSTFFNAPKYAPDDDTLIKLVLRNQKKAMEDVTLEDALKDANRVSSNWEVALRMNLNGSDSLYRFLGKEFIENQHQNSLVISTHGSFDIIAVHPLNSTVGSENVMRMFNQMVDMTFKFIEEKIVDSENFWERIKAVPEFRGWEELFEENKLSINKYEGDKYVYVGIVPHASPKDEKELFEICDRKKAFRVYLMVGVMRRNGEPKTGIECFDFYTDLNEDIIDPLVNLYSSWCTRYGFGR